MNGLNVLGFSSTGFDWWLDNNVPAQSLQHESSSWLRGFGVAHFHLCLHSPSCPRSLCVQHVEGNQNCVVFSYLKLQWHKTVQTQPALTFFFFIYLRARSVTVYSPSPLLFLNFSCWTVKSSSLWPSSLLQGAKGRDSRPSTRCWTAGRRWGKRRASTRPVQVNLCGRVLFSTRPLYTPRSSRRSSGSLFRPDTRRHKRPQSPASTWSCLTRWRCVEVSHPGQSSSGK